MTFLIRWQFLKAAAMRESDTPRPAELLKSRYPTYVRNALIAAIALHILLFALAPPFDFTPYRMEPPPTPPFEGVFVSDPPEIPEEPYDPPAPDGDPQPAPDAQEDPEDEVPPTPPHKLDPVPAGVSPPVDDADPFVAVDKLPELEYYKAPRYPDLAREAGIEGTVRVKVLIGADGEVLSVDVLTSDVTASMERAALTAAQECRFLPGEQGMRPVKAYVIVPFRFSLTR